MMFKKYSYLYVCLSFLATCLWVYLAVSPTQQNVWRIKLHLPMFGAVNLPAYPLVRLATSTPGRYVLSNTEWHSPYGEVFIHEDSGALEITCASCVLQLSEISKQPLRFETLNLNVRSNEGQLSGSVKFKQDNGQIELLFTGWLDQEGIDLKWSMPKTRISTVISLLKAHSSVLKKAKITGEIALTGNLQWPSRRWSIVPDLQRLTITGLGTERLKTAEISYRCRTTDNQLKPAKYHWVNLSQMSRWLPRAVIIAEDAHFNEHPGYNIETLIYILAQNNINKQLGGSTLTQQLAKNFFTGGERSWLRKLEELLYAVEMENTLGKHRILALYLNTVDLGPGICGVAQGSEVYFKRKPSQLTPVQAAWLASIIRNPHRAWQEQFLTKTPDVQRLAWLMSYMPKKARLSSDSLILAKLDFK